MTRYRGWCRSSNLNFILAAFTGLAGEQIRCQEDGTVVYTPALPVLKNFKVYKQII